MILNWPWQQNQVIGRWMRLSLMETAPSAPGHVECAWAGRGVGGSSLSVFAAAVNPGEMANCPHPPLQAIDNTL